METPNMGEIIRDDKSGVSLLSFSVLQYNASGGKYITPTQGSSWLLDLLDLDVC